MNRMVSLLPALSLIVILSACAKDLVPSKEPVQPKILVPVKDEGVVWDNVNLYAVTRWARETTGKKFLVSDRPLLEQKRITFISDRIPTKPEDAFALYESVLQMSGFVLAKVGTGDREVYKIVPCAMALKHPAEFVGTDREITPEDKFITRLFPLEHVSPQEIFAALATLVTDPKGVIPIPGAGAILVTDYDYNVERIGTLIKEMDRPKK